MWKWNMREHENNSEAVWGEKKNQDFANKREKKKGKYISQRWTEKKKSMNELKCKIKVTSNCLYKGNITALISWETISKWKGGILKWHTEAFAECFALVHVLRVPWPLWCCCTTHKKQNFAGFWPSFYTRNDCWSNMRDY